jgi:molybdopterin/thiamine biosynthesis adenylyltransferase
MSTPPGKWVVIIGAGGTMGSHLGPLLARSSGIGRITVVDRDTYETKNLASQDIMRRDVGKAKALVQARRLRHINPRLSVRAFPTAVEDVPFGLLRADLLVACVDSRFARRSINTLAWRMGIPWIDAGINADGLLARVNAYFPGDGQPCLECAWDEGDYATLEAAYPCAGETAAVAPTNAPAALGALAASLQALECQKALAGQWEDVAVGRQVTISAQAHRFHVTAFRRNQSCRLDHETWTIAPVERGPDDLTLDDAFLLGNDASSTAPGLGLRVAGQVFARVLRCLACGKSRELSLYLLGRLTSKERLCDCGAVMHAAGFDSVEWLRPETLPPALREASLRSVGVASGDVVSIEETQRVAHHQIGGPK